MGLKRLDDMNYQSHHSSSINSSTNPEVLFKKLLEYKNPLFYICLGYTLDYHQAEELTQDVYLKAWEKIKFVKAYDNLKGWLYTIARNTCIDYSRREKVRKLFLSKHKKIRTTENIKDNPPEKRSIREQEGNQLKDIIYELPGKLKQVFILREYGEFSYNEIAEILKVKIGTVHSRMHKAKTRAINNFKGKNHEK